MNYQSYALLNGLLDAERRRVEQDWSRATTYFDHVRGDLFERAYNRVQEQFLAIDQARAELRELARAYYKDHPNEYLRAFWCGQ